MTLSTSALPVAQTDQAARAAPSPRVTATATARIVRVQSVREQLQQQADENAPINNGKTILRNALQIRPAKYSDGTVIDRAAANIKNPPVMVEHY